MSKTAKELIEQSREYERLTLGDAKEFFRDVATALDRLHAYETAGGDDEVSKIAKWLPDFERHTLRFCPDPVATARHLDRIKTLLIALKRSRAFHDEITANRDRLNGLARAAEFLAERACAIAEERTAIMWGLLCVAGNLSEGCNCTESCETGQRGFASKPPVSAEVLGQARGFWGNSAERRAEP